MSLRIGQLTRKVTFQRAAVTRDALNTPVAEGWTDVATVMARRSSVRDAERVAGAGVGREVTDRFLTHWAAVLETLKAGDQLYDHQSATFYRILGSKEPETIDGRPVPRRSALEFSAVARPDLAP